MPNRKKVIVIDSEPEEEQEVLLPKEKPAKKPKSKATKKTKKVAEAVEKKSEKVVTEVETTATETEVETSTALENAPISIEDVKNEINTKILEIRNVMTSESFENDMQRGLQKSQVTALRRLRSKLEHIKKEAHSTKKLILNVMKDKKKVNV